MKRITWVECPGCKMYSDQKVIKSERNSKFITIRRRLCYECGHKWFTIQYPEMIVPDIQARYASREWRFVIFLYFQCICSCSTHHLSLCIPVVFFVGAFITASVASSSITLIIALDSTASALAWFFIMSIQKAFILSISLQAHTSLHRSSIISSASGGSSVCIIFIKPSSFMSLKRGSGPWKHPGLDKGNCLIVYRIVCLFSYSF